MKTRTMMVALVIVVAGGLCCQPASGQTSSTYDVATILSKLSDIESRLNALEATPKTDVTGQPAVATVTLTADNILQLLRDGNERFCTDSQSTPRRDLVRLQETARQGQRPLATVVTCSDSRVAPEILFDQRLGDIFSVRVAGNVCGVDEIASCEYGIAHLQTPILVVLGHTACGAIAAASTDAETEGSIPAILDRIRPAVARAQEQATGRARRGLVPVVTRENVYQSIEDLIVNSDMIRERVRSGKLTVIGAICDVSTGRVQWLGPHPRQSDYVESGLQQQPAH